MNAVRLFTAVWTFTSSVCQADNDDFSVRCDDVTGSVGENVSFTCRVSLQRPGCCVKMYKFRNRESYKTVCKEYVTSCDERNSFACSYAPTAAVTDRFRFFLQTNCGTETTEFTVSVTENIKHETLAEVVPPGKTERGVSETSGFNIAVIAAVVSSLIIISVLAIYKITQKLPEWRTFLVF